MKTRVLFCLVLAVFTNLGSMYGQEEDCTGQFKTFTIGGWGTECHGGNPGCYRDANFAGAFPAGLIIGCGSNTITLTSSLAVQNFLPSGGTPSLLSGALVDPLDVDVANTLASQLVGVTLAVGFDAYDPNFSSSGDAFGGLEILNGPHAGMTVQEFLDYANQVIGGCIPGDLSELNGTATAINENYHGGNVDNGNLDCNPCPNCQRFDFTISSTNLLCNGDNDATITISTSGGTAPYFYYLDDVLVSTTNNPSYIFTGLAAGTYVVAVNDSAGNSGSSDPTITITEPSALELTAQASSPLCAGGTGSITFSATGGTGVIVYTVNGSEATSPLEGLGSGTYTIVATDENGCDDAEEVTITVPDPVVLTAQGTSPLCYGSLGSITFSATGGTGTITYTVNGNPATSPATDLAAGTYTIVATDENGCTDSEEVTITIPDALVLTISQVDIVCYGGTGTATANVTGGTPPYSYSWNTDPEQTTETAVLSAGTWTVTVTDDNDCPVSGSVTLEEPPCEGFTTVTMGGYGAKCAGGNWGCYVKNNFASNFPLGLTIGSGTRFLKLTSAGAVEAFLPSGSTARALNAGTLINPTEGTYSNVLAGQTVALTLSVAFDASNPNFSSSNTLLGDLIVGAGPFAGLTVNELLDIANTILGGGASPFTAAAINGALDSVNRNYDNGNVNLGYLVCPCVVSKIANALADTSPKANMLIYPNPMRGNATVEISLNYNSTVSVSIYSINGQLVKNVFKGNLQANETYSVNADASILKAGVYIVKLISDRDVSSKVIMIAE